MALWKESDSTKQKNQAVASQDPAAEVEAVKEKKPDDRAERRRDLSNRAGGRETSESVISADLTIEGKIEGAGHVRLIGKFKGDVKVQGDFTIEPGAKVTGSVRADRIVIGGELDGNIEGASSVELLESGVMSGDLKAESLIVASGSRMTGQVQFGWDEQELRSTQRNVKVGSADE